MKHSKMKDLPRGPLYAKYGTSKCHAKIMDAEAKRLHGDRQVNSKTGIYEYLLGGSVDTKLLSARVFDDRTEAARYQQQTTPAEQAGRRTARYAP